MEVDPVPFHLAAELRGHGEDVRAVAVAGPHGVATTSRDKTLRTWPVEGGAQLRGESTVFVGHTDFVGPVVWAPPGLLPVAPEGALVTGSRDTTVLVWHPTAAVTLQRLAGHSLQVSALCITAAGDVVSGDHGGEIRVWRDGTCAQVLSCGAPVLSLCALPTGGFVASTGNPGCGAAFYSSASGQWTRSRSAERLHGDAVRCVRVVDALPGGWVTASHDGTARLWLGWDARSPEVEFVGHTALVYSVCPSPDGSSLVTGSEDGTAKVWDVSTGACTATLQHPACVWDAAWLPTGELVTACGDGVARIWSRDASKADAALTSALNATLAAQKAARPAADAGAPASGLPPGVALQPRSALSKPGARDGVTIVVEEDGGGMAYSWDAAAMTWQVIGQVVAPPQATGGVVSTSPNGATFTFDVDVADGAPPRQLTYSIGQNPYSVADTWLAEQGMPVGYRDQIVNFLVQNTGGPTGAAAQAMAAAGAFNADPFTGGGSYVPSAMPTAPASGAPPPRALQYVPVRTQVTFDAVPSGDALAGKLRAFGASHGAAFAEGGPLAGPLDALLACAAKGAGAKPSDVPSADVATPVLTALLAWPADQLFPVFDLMRLLVLSPDGARVCGAPDVLAALGPAMQRAACVGQDAPGGAAAHTTALRLACNAAAHPGPLRVWLHSHVNALLDWFAGSPVSGSKPVRAAFGSLLLNLALHLASPAALASAAAAPPGGDGDSALVLLSATVAAAVSTPPEDDDALFRALVALGTLCQATRGLATTARDLGAREVADAAVKRGGEGKAAGAAQDVVQLLA